MQVIFASTKLQKPAILMVTGYFMYKVLKMTYLAQKRHLDRGNWSDILQLDGFRCVYIEESPLLSTISFSFKFPVIQEWFLTIQVRATAVTTRPVC